VAARDVYHLRPADRLSGAVAELSARQAPALSPKTAFTPTTPDDTLIRFNSPAPFWLERAARFALALAFAVTAALTAEPLVDLVTSGSPSRALAQEEDHPLTGFWQSHVNGDTVNVVLKTDDLVWAATEGGGLVRWSLADRSYEQFVFPDDGLLSNVVSDIALDGAGYLWLATEAGLTRFDPRTSEVVNYTPSNTPSMPADVVTALAFAPDGKLWVGFGQKWDHIKVDPRTREPGTFLTGGLARFDPETRTFDEAIHAVLDGNPAGQRYRTIPSENVTKLQFDNAGILWIGTKPFFVWDSDYCPPGENCATFGGYWVAVGGGLAGFKTGPDGLPTEWRNWSPGEASGCYSNHITDLALDQQDRTWVAHQGRGLHAMTNGLMGGGCSGSQIFYQRPRGGLQRGHRRNRPRLDGHGREH
jgi:sugar lactone lactonase YvrE